MTGLWRSLQDGFSRPDSSARNWALSTVFWLVIGPVVGLIAGLQMRYPDVFGSARWLEFGRLRLVHVTIVTIAVIYMGMIAGYCYVVPRLCERPLITERLLNWCMVGWNAAVVAAIVAIVLGHNQGREWAELPWALDVGVGVLFGVLGGGFLMTVWRRRRERLYPSLWYWSGTIVWFFLVWVIGNLIWLPPSGALSGLRDSIYNWFIGHNILALFITTAGVGLWYYFVPLLADKPLYSEWLSMIGFWTYVGFYTQAGTHHLMQAPVPMWSKVLGLVVSVGLLVPVFTVITNIWMTMRGRWQLTLTNLPLRFMITASVFYLLTCLQGPSQGFMSFQKLIHFTNWVVGHAHLALLGTFVMLIIGFLYAMIPHLAGRPLHSQSLVATHYWLLLVGFGGMFLSLTAAGLVQGSSWLNGNPVEKVIGLMAPYFSARALFGALVAIGSFVMAYNVWRTFRPPAAATAAERQE